MRNKPFAHRLDRGGMACSSCHEPHGRPAKGERSSAMTGHLIFSTLHTNSAIATVSRLLDLKIDGSTLANALSGILAQRLVRKICDDCKRNCGRLTRQAA